VKGDRSTSGLSPFRFIKGIGALGATLPKKRGTHRDFAKKESGNWPSLRGNFRRFPLGKVRKGRFGRRGSGTARLSLSLSVAVLSMLWRKCRASGLTKIGAERTPENQAISRPIAGGTGLEAPRGRRCAVCLTMPTGRCYSAAIFLPDGRSGANHGNGHASLESGLNKEEL
jgi:hypothetical protein